MVKATQDVESLPLRRSDDPIKPKIVDVIQNDAASASSSEESKPVVFNQYANEQNEKFGFLQALMDKIRKHAHSMGLNGDMQVHVVEVKPLFGGRGQGEKENDIEENASFEQSLADGFGEYAMPHQDFGPINDAYDNDRLTFDRHSMRRPFGPFNRFDGPSQIYDDYSEQQPQEPMMQNQFQWNNGFPQPQFGFQQQPANWWGPARQQAMEVQTNQWNGFPQVPVQQFQQAPQVPQLPPQQAPQQPWYQPYSDNVGQQQQDSQQNQNPWQAQNDDWMIQKHERQNQNSVQIPFQPNPAASNADFNTPMDVISDNAVAPPSTAIAADRDAGRDASEENVISPDQSLESIADGKFLPIRSDDKPIDAADAHLFQIDDPSSFRR
ncbi:CRE-PQN-35 protein [Caenorhabditis remanei]|uniref:CRE-PQN-35 protein n=1 Tax=Caenorhabditis remanei TaxID=31234 RepID=E3MRY7_CAERE|nr:CRE-PQN-35 protein [Caenorhabditis remanei]